MPCQRHLNFPLPSVRAHERMKSVLSGTPYSGPVLGYALAMKRPCTWSHQDWPAEPRIQIHAIEINTTEYLGGAETRQGPTDGLTGKRPARVHRLTIGAQDTVLPRIQEGAKSPGHRRAALRSYMK